MWRKLERNIKEIDSNFPFQPHEVKNKFYNLLKPYKRVKKTNNLSGQGRTYWPCFEMFDEVYGTKYSIVPPKNNLCSSLPDEIDLEYWLNESGPGYEQHELAPDLEVREPRKNFSRFCNYWFFFISNRIVILKCIIFLYLCTVNQSETRTRPELCRKVQLKHQNQFFLNVFNGILFLVYYLSKTAEGWNFLIQEKCVKIDCVS